jgi:hypothetical protein
MDSLEPENVDREPFVIGGIPIAPGERASLDLALARHHIGGELEMPVAIVHGRRPGPKLFVSAALHGDEINGTEIIRRLLRHKALERVRGVLVAVPVVNVFGFIARSRYLPDRRDLNRSFPGSARGSLAARLAYTFLTEIASQVDVGIDLHTGAVHRSNFPQMRVRTGDDAAMQLAVAFGTPLVVNSDLVAGSLRSQGDALGIPIIVYEAGEALRFDEWAIRAGVRGVLGVMRHLGMLPPVRNPKPRPAPLIARGTTWVRAPAGGILRMRARLGTAVHVGETLGHIGDPLGEEEVAIISEQEGIVIGCSNIPLVNEGDALWNIARFDDSPEVVSANFEDAAPGAFGHPASKEDG